MEKKRNISTLAMRILSILFCLTLISMWMTANMYARYTTEANGEDSARVAKFYISDTNDLTKTYAVTLTPDKTETIGIKIINNSEVAVRYTFSFETKGNAPLTISMENDSTTAESGTTDVLTKESDENIWNVEKEAAVNEEDCYQAEISLGDAGYQYSGSVAMITMTVKAEQID